MRHRNQAGTILRITICLVLVAGLSATVVVAQVPDKSVSNTSFSPPPREFEPLTRSERFAKYLAGVADAESLVRAVASAGIQQATHTPKEWSRGPDGFGKRVGNAYAEHVIHRTVEYGISAALHEDNRYFVSGQVGFLRRTKYAFASTFLARHDDGSRSLSFSRIGAAAGTGFVSRQWQPRSTTSAGDGAVSFGVIVATDIGFNILREFWPGVKRNLRKD
jgi:hypothetical protein